MLLGCFICETAVKDCLSTNNVFHRQGSCGPVGVLALHQEKNAFKLLLALLRTSDIPNQRLLFKNIWSTSNYHCDVAQMLRR